MNYDGRHSFGIRRIKMGRWRDLSTALKMSLQKLAVTSIILLYCEESQLNNFNNEWKQLYFCKGKYSMVTKHVTHIKEDLHLRRQIQRLATNG